jgi:NADH pyrophosphatase NudC (nudix superfamily)
MLHRLLVEVRFQHKTSAPSPLLAITHQASKGWECPTDDGEFLLHWWTADIDSHELRLDPTEVADARWVTCEDFLELEPTFSGDRDFITNVLPTLTPSRSESEEQEP